jgi:Protein of unknown function (DUF2752)
VAGVILRRAIDDDLRMRGCLFFLHYIKNILSRFKRKYFELFSWLFSLTALAVMQPTTDSHYSLCLFKMLGWQFCPGCGLGHSISWFFHGNVRASLSAHPLGIFAIFVILSRIFTLLRVHVFSKQIDHYAN